jgi:hypothetical protein
MKAFVLQSLVSEDMRMQDFKRQHKLKSRMILKWAYLAIVADSAGGRSICSPMPDLILR